MTETTDTSPRDVKRSPRRSPNPVWSALVLLYRLLLLGVGGTIAWFVGIAIATFFPGQVSEPPFLEKVFTQTDRVVEGTRQVIRPTDEAASPGIGSPTASPTVFSDRNATRAQLQQELEQIQAEMNELGSRASDIQAQLEGNGSSATPGSTAGQEQLPLTITLPSDALFDADQRTLRPVSKPVLKALVDDLKQYPGASIRIVGHTDRTTETTNSLELSFAQAQAISGYLTTALDDSYQFTVLGQGDRQPIVKDGTAAQQQRNRRIEILIDPR